MKKLFGLLTSRWVISIVGLILVALLIWFAGPLIAVAGKVPLASTFVRLICILALVVVWGVWNLILALRDRKTNQAVIEGLVGGPEPVAPGASASTEEVQALRERFADALHVLKDTKLGGRWGKRYLYQLPWYVLIGPPGGGKTTALNNSGLNFPLAERFGKEAIQGIGGTRNCDWYFTDEAVLLDTAGRYMTQDSDETVDRSAWQGFLALLKKHRRRRPIDGLLIALSITDVNDPDPARRIAHAEAVRRRVQEIYGTLKVRAPIYVFFTKCDLVAGFSEFFDDMSREDREQVWGMTFALDQSEQPARAIEGFGGEFDALLDRLSGRLIARLDQESDIGRRGLLLSFPQQMAALRGPIQDFLATAFTPTRYEEPGLLRGLYLTSATQQGTPIDRIISAVAGAFGLDRQAMPAFSGHGRSYFLTRMLRDVVFHETYLVTPTGFLDRHRNWVVRGVYVGTAAIAGLAAAALVSSYLGNSRYVDTVDQEATAYQRDHDGRTGQPGGMAGTLQALNALRTLPGGYAEREQRGSLLGLGLGQEEKLGGAAEQAYQRGLERLLLPRLTARLEQQIRDNLGRNEFLYEALKVYLMLATPQRRDANLLKAWIERDVQNQYPGVANETLREDFARHLQALLEGGNDVAPVVDAALVAQARQRLLSLPMAQRVFSQIKAEQLAGSAKAWSLADRIPADQLRFFQRRSGASMSAGIPFFFTADGYKEVFLKAQPQLASKGLAETWVLGPDYARLQTGETGSKLTTTVGELYFRDYIKTWDDLLNDIDVVPFQNIEQQVDLVRLMAQPNSPIKAILTAISKETTLAGSPGAAAEPAVKAGEVIGAVQKTIDRLLGPSETAAAERVGGDPAAVVDRHFEPINKLVSADGQAPAPIEKVLASLNELYAYLRQVELAAGQGAVPEGRELAARLTAEAGYQPEPLRHWLQGLTRTSSSLAQKKIGGETAKRIAAAFATTVSQECRNAVAGRYPMVKSSPDDVPLADFGRFFGLGGVMDKFFQDNLASLADTAVRPWRWNSSARAEALPAGGLSPFERAARIRQAFFAGGTQPSVSFDLEPQTLDSSASQVLLEVGELRFVYAHGPRLRQRIQWPQQGSAIARLVFTSATDGHTVSASANGPWALFRLLDKAQIKTGAGADRLQVTFDVEGIRAAFAIYADSVVNPLVLPDLQQFRCQDRL